MTEGASAAAEDRALYLEIDGWEGPLDLLLDLARRQKVDLLRISILELVDQYLGFIAQAEALRLELAADYLVMKPRYWSTSSRMEMRSRSTFCRRARSSSRSSGPSQPSISR